MFLFIITAVVSLYSAFFYFKKQLKHLNQKNDIAQKQFQSSQSAQLQATQQLKEYLNQQEAQKLTHLQLISSTLDESANGADRISQELEVILDNSAQLSTQLSEITQLALSTKQQASIGTDCICQAQTQLEQLIHSEQDLQDLLSKFAQIHEKSQAIRYIGAEAEMLALNAAIEAARAGEAGRGFAIVADNMKELAKKSQTSTLEILNIVQESDALIQSVNKNFSQRGRDVSDAVTQVLENFSSINHSISDIDQRVNQLDHTSSDNHKSAEFVAANAKTSVETLVQRLSKLVSMITHQEVINVSPLQAKEHWQEYDEVIDVRREKEWNDELGHIANISFSTLQTDFKEYVKTLDPEKCYLFICRSGGRSTKAAQMAMAHGISQVYNLDGGMLAWRKAGL